MANNDKITKILEETKQKINSLIERRTQKFAEREKITGSSQEQLAVIKEINEEITAINHELSEFGRELTSKKTELADNFERITAPNNNKGKKVVFNYEINGKKDRRHIIQANRGKLNNIVNEINLNNKLIAFYEENVTIDERGIVSQYKIDEKAVAKMSEEEKLAYFDNLCAKMADQNKVTNPAKKVTLGNRYSVINACDLEIYLKCLEEFRKAQLAVETKKHNIIGIKAAQDLLRLAIKVEDVEVSTNFRIDWDYVNAIETLEEKAEYFNKLAISIASAPKTKPEKVPLGGSKYATVNSSDKMIFLQCFNEFRKVKKAIADRNKPSYTIDWKYVNSLKSAERRADYFEDLCGKIDAVEKKDTVEIPFRNRSFIINKVDEEIFKTAIQEFENNYIQFLKEQKEAELTRIAEEKKKAEEAELARLAEEKKKAEEAELTRIAEEKKKAEEAELARLAEEKKKAEEAELARLADVEAKRADIAQLDTFRDKIATDAKQTALVPLVTDNAEEIELASEPTALSDEEKDDYSYLQDVEISADDFEDDDSKNEQEIIDSLEKTNENNSTVDFFAVEDDEDIQLINLDEIDNTDYKINKKDKDKKEEERKSLKDIIKDKLGKKKDKKTKQIDSYSDNYSSETIKITDTEALKVLTSRSFTENISNSKLYILRKELYLNIMDWIADKKIVNKAQIVTKRHTTEIDVKYADIYRYIANKYEKLEDKYERRANNTHHKLKVGFAFGTMLMLSLLIGEKSIAKNNTDADLNIHTDYIKYETEDTNTREINNLTKINPKNDEEEEEFKVQDKTTVKETQESDTNIHDVSLQSTSSYNDSSYNYTDGKNTESYNIKVEQIYTNSHDTNDEIIKEIERNNTPILHFVH